MIEQLVPESAQVAGDGKVTAPAPPVCENFTVSAEIVPAAPETVAVQDEVEPAGKEAGVHETAVVVVARVTVTLAAPELPT